MGNRATRKSIQSLRLRIAEHEDKIRLQRALPNPDVGRIRHWESEVRAFQLRLDRLEKRLRKRRQES
jgi:hypothetical protein